MNHHAANLRAGQGPPARARTGRRLARGLTLIEVAVATVLVGLGVAALMTATAAGTKANAAGQRMTLGLYLAGEIREWSLKLPFRDPQTPGALPGLDAGESVGTADDLDDLRAATFSPPCDASGATISELAGWSQQVTLEWLDPNSLLTTVEPGASDVVRVTVNVTYRGAPAAATSWLVTRKALE